MSDKKYAKAYKNAKTGDIFYYKDEDAQTEIKNAKGTYDNLKARLDNTDEQYNTINAKIESGEIGSNVEIVDNLTTDDITKVLSAKQGKVLKNEIDNIKLNFSTEQTDSNYILKYNNIVIATIPLSVGGNSGIIEYSITTNTTNCTLSNAAIKAEYGTSYTTTINSNAGYVLTNVIVTMGGTDITSSSVSGNSISINKVTGNIIITATTTKSNTAIVGSISNNVITLDGITTAGTYTLKYEDDNGALSSFNKICDMEVE